MFFDLAIEDLRRAADLFLPIHERTDGVDGWVSLEVSPLLAYDTQARRSRRPRTCTRVPRARNLFIKIPGTPEGLPAITGVHRRRRSRQRHAAVLGRPVPRRRRRVPDGRRAAASSKGSIPHVGSVASVFMSRWDVAVADKVPADLKDQLGLAVGLDVYRAYRELMDSDRVLRLENCGRAHAAAAVGEHEDEGPRRVRHAVRARPRGAVHRQHDARRHARELLRPRRGRASCSRATAATPTRCLRSSPRPASTSTALAAQLQSDGAKSFVTSWKDLIARIASQSTALK